MALKKEENSVEEIKKLLYVQSSSSSDPLQYGALFAPVDSAVIGRTKNPLSRRFVNRPPAAGIGLFPIISRPFIDLAINVRPRIPNVKYYRATINRAYYANEPGIVTRSSYKKSALEGESVPFDVATLSIIDATRRHRDQK